jgi:hypothetical protein
MSEQPNIPTPEAPEDEAQSPTTQPQPPEHEHVRTIGETTVDDALGAADDPL